MSMKVSLGLLLLGACIGCMKALTCPENRYFDKDLKDYAWVGSDYARTIDKSPCGGSDVTCSRAINDGPAVANFWDGLNKKQLDPGLNKLLCNCADDPTNNCAVEYEVWSKARKTSGELNVGNFDQIGTVVAPTNDIEGSFVMCPSVALGNNGGRHVVIYPEPIGATLPLANGGTITVSAGDYVLQRFDAAPGVTNSQLNSLSCSTLVCMAEDTSDATKTYTFTVPIGSHVPVSNEVFWELPTVGIEWEVDCICSCGSANPASLDWADRETSCAKVWWIQKL